MRLRLPVLVVNGSDDIVIPTINSYILQQFLPSAELVLYPDANHGAHFQYPDLFVRHARIFLDALTISLLAGRSQVAGDDWTDD